MRGLARVSDTRYPMTGPACPATDTSVTSCRRIWPSTDGTRTSPALSPGFWGAATDLSPDLSPPPAAASARTFATADVTSIERARTPIFTDRSAPTGSARTLVPLGSSRRAGADLAVRGPVRSPSLRWGREGEEVDPADPPPPSSAPSTGRRRACDPGGSSRSPCETSQAGDQPGELDAEGRLGGGGEPATGTAPIRPPPERARSRAKRSLGAVDPVDPHRLRRRTRTSPSPTTDTKRFAHSTASSRSRHSISAQPPMSSLASVNGPSITVNFPSFRVILAPIAVGASHRWPPGPALGGFLQMRAHLLHEAPAWGRRGDTLVTQRVSEESHRSLLDRVSVRGVAGRKRRGRLDSTSRRSGGPKPTRGPNFLSDLLPRGPHRRHETAISR